MTKLYKLTDQDSYTRRGQANECLWGEGFTHSGTGEGELCGPGYIHAYTDPLLAVLLNPIHAGYDNLLLWVAEGKIAQRDGQLKVGCVSLTTIEEIDLPEISTTQRVAFAILCAKAVHDGASWNAWADKWLSGEDRSAARAADAAWAVGAAWAADAAWAAAGAARAAAAAGAAARAAWAADAADAADAAWAAARAAGAAAAAGAADAADAAWDAAEAAWAADAADAAADDIDLAAIAREAMKYD